MALNIPFTTTRPDVFIGPQSKPKTIFDTGTFIGPISEENRKQFKSVTPAETIRRQFEAEKKVFPERFSTRVRIPFAKEATFGVPKNDPLLSFFAPIAARVPELLVDIPVNAVNFFRKNINTLIAGKPVETEQFKSILGFDPARFGIEDRVLTDTITSLFNQADIEEQKNPSNGDTVKATTNALKAVSKTVLPDVLDVLFAYDITKGLIRGTIGAARVTARQLPEDLLFKITEQNISPQAIKDVLIGGTRLSSEAEFKVADDFIKGLSPEERSELFRIARSYEAAGLSKVTIRTGAEPTALGRFSKVKIPFTTKKLPPRISGLLEGPKISPQAGFINIEAAGEEILALARKAKDIKDFKGLLTKEQAALLVARGLTADTVFGGVKATDDLTSSISKAKASGQSFDEWVKRQKGNIVLRQGEIQKGGAYFTSGEGGSTYFDLQELGKAKKAYDISGAKIVSSDTPEMKLVIQDALKLKNNPKDIKTLTESLDDGFVNYGMNDNIPSIIKAAKARGYDGIKVWEADSVGSPDSLFIWNTDKVKTRSQLKAEWDGVGAKTPEQFLSPRSPIQRQIESKALSPIISQRGRESTFLKKKLQAEGVIARRGARAGQKVGEAKAENIAEARQEKAVRKEQLKSLRGGIEIRARKDAIIAQLQNAAGLSQRVKNDIVDLAKDILDPADRGKALSLVRDAKNSRDLTKAFARILRWAEDSAKKEIRNEILKLQKNIMDSPSIAIDYKAKVKELMGDFNLKGQRESTLERLKKTQEFLQSEAAKGNDVEMPKRVLKALELLNRTPFEQITINQLNGLKAEMELLETLGRTKLGSLRNIWDSQKEKIYEEISLQGAKPIQKIELLRPEIGERLTITQKFKNLVWSISNQAARIDKAILPMDVIFDLLDGGNGLYNGANFRHFKARVDAGYGKYITRKAALQEPVIDLATKYKLEDTNFERMGVVAAREQDGGMEKLIASGFTEDTVNAVTLSKEEQEVLNLMRSTFDSQFLEIKEIMRLVYNQPVEKVKNYFSFMTDFKAMDDSELFTRFGSQTPEQFGVPKKNVEAGFVKTRVGGEQKIKINALDVFIQHTDNTSYLLEVGETSKMLGELAASPEYAELVGEVGQLMVREWVDVIARKGGASGAQNIAVLDTLRKNVGIGILGLKLSTVAIQPTALIDGMGFIGVGYGTKGFTNFVTSKEWRAFVLNMPEISNRLGGEFALRELTNDNWMEEIQRKGFIPMQTLDQMTAGAIAAGAYERKMIELGKEIDFNNYDPEALAYAQLVVRRTQSSGSFKDVPLAVSRGALTGNRSVDRAALQFQNFLLTRWSRIRHDAIRAGVNTKDPKKGIPIFFAIIMAALASSGIRLGVNKVQDFITGREDEDTPMDDLQQGFIYEMTGNVPFLGNTVGMALYGGEMFPILDVPKGLVNGLNRVIVSKSEKAKLRGFTEFLGSSGMLLGIPGSVQAEQLLRGALQDEKKSGGLKLNIPSIDLKNQGTNVNIPSMKIKVPSISL